VEDLAAKLRYSIARSPENSGMVQVELEDVKQWIAIRQNMDELASEFYVVSRSCCGTDHGRSEGVLKFHRDLAAFSDVIDERWTKACNAGPSGMPDARIDDTSRSRIQQFVR